MQKCRLPLDGQSESAARIYSRLSDLEDKVEASRESLADELGEVSRKPFRCHAMTVSHHALPLLVGRPVGIAVAPRGHLRIFISCTVTRGKITELKVFADPLRVRKLNLAILPD